MQVFNQVIGTDGQEVEMKDRRYIFGAWINMHCSHTESTLFAKTWKNMAWFL
jgi:hypothetical protein